MARIRTIKPETWVDEKFTELTFPARLLFIGLWNFCDREGRMVYSPKRIKAQIFPCDAVEIVSLFQELQSIGLVTIYQASNARILSIPNFSKHQIVNVREPASLLPASGVASIVCEEVPAQDSTEQVLIIDESVQKSEEGKGREWKGNTHVESKSDSTLVLVPDKSPSIAPIWDYFVEKLGKSSVYEFSEKRKTMGNRCYEWALKRTRDPSKAEDWMKIAVDELERSDYHMGRGKYQGQTRYSDWENIFKTVDKFQWWLERNNEKCQ